MYGSFVLFQGADSPLKAYKPLVMTHSLHPHFLFKLLMPLRASCVILGF